MIARIATSLALLVLAAALSTGCQSTQAESAELAEDGDQLLDQGKLKIEQRSQDVEVVSATLLAGEGPEDNSAVALRLRNVSSRGLRDVPVLIDVQDAKGKSLYKNDLIGADATLISVPAIQPGEEVFWVHDQIYTERPPEKVEVEVGANAQPLPATIPDVTVADPKVEKDPVSGAVLAGEIQNNSGEEQQDVYFYAVGLDGDEVVSAGRGAIDKLKAESKEPQEYRIFPVGDPNKGELTTYVMPTVFE